MPQPTLSNERSRRAALQALGQHIRRLRLTRDMSQTRLGQLAGLSYKFIGRVELGQADPGAITLLRLARALDVSIAEIFEPLSLKNAKPRPSPMDMKGVEEAIATLERAIERVAAPAPPTRKRASRSTAITKPAKKPAERRPQTATTPRMAIALHLDEAERYLSQRASGRAAIRRGDHAAVIKKFVETGSYAEAAKAGDLTRERVRQLVVTVMRHLRTQNLA